MSSSPIVEKEGEAAAEETTPSSEDRDEVTQSFPPSHILQDGRHIFLPEPTDAERSRFLERSITRHKLLNQDVKTEQDDEEEGKEGDTKDTTQPKVHPLAVASARLNSNGISELSKAINLTSLVGSAEYFGLSNIVNPLLETTTSKPAAKVQEATTDDAALRALYLGKRKRSQFEWAATALARHERRLSGAVATQQLMDQRLFAIRPHWRLVAPEHGTRARAHATRPTEVVAIDVDVYDRDRTGSTSTTTTTTTTNSSSTLGQLARRVPRYATVELPKDYKVADDVQEWKDLHELSSAASMKVDSSKTDNSDAAACKTRAEPFAVADPTLGKIDVDFDPEKVPMLSLQLDIEKDSTGYCQSAHLSPLTTLGEKADEDEKVVVALQRSLFCASLFESIRRELIPEEHVDDGTMSQVKNRARQHIKQQQDVWLSSAMEENYLPPPSLMVGGALSVVHCHEGEVKVQLDSEYALTVKLVEAEVATGAGTGTDNSDDAMKVDMNGSSSSSENSGSQTPGQLHALCRALLLHAQHVYHQHSIEIRKLLEEKKRKAKETTAVPMGLETKRKKDELPQAHILQDCVALGVKMITERKLRRALTRVQHWLQNQSTTAKLSVEWMPLSVFDKRSQFVLSFSDSLVLDVSLERDEVTITRFGENGEYRKVLFHDDTEFELFLKLELRKQLKEQQQTKILT